MRLTDIVQVYPSRITITSPRTPRGARGLVDSYHKKLYKDQERARYESNFRKKAKDYNLSKASKKKIFDSINTMYCLSKPRTIEMQNGKKLFNFRLSFITLTLPAKQNHSDTEIKSLCINQFLFEIKRKYGIENFVWKAELQKNKNIHFHLILDQYIDFQALRRRWNRIINKLGYVDAYQNKFQNMSLLDYHAHRNNKYKCEFEQSKKAYAQGKKNNWTNPNSVDAKQVRGKKDLAIYMGKYFSKQVTTENGEDMDLDRLKNFGRTWSRSYTLVRLKFHHKYLVSEVEQILLYLRNAKNIVKEIKSDWFTAFYFNVSDLCYPFQKFHQNYMNFIANSYDYPKPAT